MPSADALRTLVVGGGQAGGQFLRAMRYGQCAERFDVVALADIDPGRDGGEVGVGLVSRIAVCDRRSG